LGHIFDANTLHNLALASALSMLPETLDGRLYLGRVVRRELERGARRFPQANLHKLPDPRWSAYIARFQGLDAQLDALGFTTLEVTSASTRPGEFAFLACLQDEWLMEEGEAEAFTLAAYRGLILYSDEWKVNEEARNYTADHFPCPYFGNGPPSHARVEVHTTAWLLLEAVEKRVVTFQEADAYYLAMREVWPRHPRKTLAQLRDGEGIYW
jgi:hypothetical protein